MPNPWLFALKAIPWSTILASAPSIVKSAETLLSSTRSRRSEGAPPPDALHGLAPRVALLEQRDQATAELIAQVTVQISALATATEVLEARLRWLIVLGIGSAVLSLAAIGIAMFAR